MAYVASEATSAVAMHLTKWLVHQATLDVGRPFWPLAAGMSLAMIAGSYVGKRLIERLPGHHFQKLAVVLLAATAFQMILTG